MRWANSRAITSFGPPAANGLTMVSGRVGQSSAMPGDAVRTVMSATARLKPSTARDMAVSMILAPARDAHRRRRMREAQRFARQLARAIS